MTPTIEIYAKDIVIIHNDRFGLDESDQRWVLAWFAKNKPEMVREIVCEECPEHNTVDTDEPRCTENHHNDDGTLIQYLGSGRPCVGCKSRDSCFKIFYNYWRREIG